MNSNPANGVHVAYYIGNGWKMLPIFKNEKIVEKWTTEEIRLDRDQILPLLPGTHSNFGLVFDTCIEIDTDGLYTFYLQSDDGCKLYINDNKVVDNDGGHGLLEKEGEIELKKGRHKLKVEFFNDHGGYWVEAFYKGPGIPRQIIPADKLFKCNN